MSGKIAVLGLVALASAGVWFFFYRKGDVDGKTSFKSWSPKK